MVPSILSLVAWAAASTPEPAPEPEDAAPLEQWRVPGDPVPGTIELPPTGVAPLSGPRRAWLPAGWTHPSDGAAPFQRGVDPRAPEGPIEPVYPLGPGPRDDPPLPIDPNTAHMVRVDYLLGVAWRLEPVDVAMSTSVEYGRMQGFSGAFNLGFLISPDRNFVQAFDFPIGLGAVYRRRLGTRPLYGSVGMSGGLLIHRAKTNQGVIRRVDPDLRLPLRFAWTVERIGVSVAVVPAFSVRQRSYERRGAQVWKRHSVRVGLVFGLHWDFMVDPAKRRRSRRLEEMDPT